jgi:Fibronectin type III domain
VSTVAPSVRNLRQTAADWSTVTLSWDPPAGAPTPDGYKIFTSQNQTDPVGTVPGTVTTYTVTKLPENGGHHTYVVYALWSGNPSHIGPSVDTATRQPPLNSDFQVNYHTASSPGGTLKTGTNWEDDWTFSPTSCSGNGCREGLNADFQPPGDNIANTPFTVTLKPSGSHYVGTTKAQIFACGSTGLVGFTTDTVDVDISPVHTSGGAWSTFKGTVDVTMPYSAYYTSLHVQSTTMYCPDQTWYFTVSGS